MATKDLDSGNVIKQVYNPATEALQVDIVASSGAGGLATAAKQDQQTALLTDIENNTDGLETSLTSLDNKTPVLVAGRVPVDGSGVTQPVSAASLPLPTGAATEAKQDTTNTELLNISNKLNNYLNSPTNSSTTPLLAGGVFTGTAINISGYASIFVAVATDVPSAVGGLSVQFSPDGTNWDHISHSYDVPANGLSYSLPTELVFMRIVYTNGGINQTYFRLTTVLNTEYIPPSLYTLSQSLSDYALATPTKTVIYGKTTGGGGGYVAVKVTPSGALTNETSVTSSVLPTGAATETTLASINSKLNPLSVLGSFVVDFTSIPNSVTAPYEITAGFGSDVKKIALYETTGETLQLRTGAASGSLLAYVGPGQDSPLDASISASTRITVRSNGNAPTAGSFIITFLG